jgi:hypothetical protein
MLTARRILKPPSRGSLERPIPVTASSLFKCIDPGPKLAGSQKGKPVRHLGERKKVAQ